MGQDDPSTKLDQPAAELRDRAGIGDEARGQLVDGMTVRTFLDALSQNGHAIDAMKVLAHALPKREAVWWACLIAAEARGPSPEAARALEAARSWVIDPTDAHRRSAFAAAQKAGLETPAGCAAAAAYFSGGSLAPADLPVVAPPEPATAKLVVGALTFCAVIHEPEKAPEKFAAFLRIGREVAEGQRPWPQAAHDRPVPSSREGVDAHAAARRPRL